MNDYLTQLGVPPKIQLFFSAEELLFNYGNEQEIVSVNSHRVPTTSNLWTAGNFLAREVFITFSVMEAIAFLTLHHSNFQGFGDLLFIAIGNRMSKGQMAWINDHLKNRSFTLVFGDDLIGRLTDIKVALAIRKKQVDLSIQGDQVIVRLKQRILRFDEQSLSLHAVETQFGIRTKIRTCKPIQQLTFFDELKHDTPK